MVRLASLLLTCLALAFLARGVSAEDEALASARAEAREALLREAERALKADGTSALESMRRSLATDLEWLDALPPEAQADTAGLAAFRKTIEDRILLLGDPRKLADADGETLTTQADGAVWAAIRLDRWLRGTWPCDVLLTDEEPAGANPRTYAFPPEDLPPPEPAAEETPGKGEPAKDEPAKGEPAKGADGKDDAPAKDEGDGDGSDAPKPEPSDTKPPEPETVSAKTVRWAREVQAAEGTAFLKRRIRPAPCPDVDALITASKHAPAYVHEDLHGLRRFAIAKKGLFDYNRPSAGLRELQSRERSLRMQADRPQPTLVDGSMVRERAVAEQKLQAAAQRAAEWRAVIVEGLDQMALALDGWKTQAALIAADLDAIRVELGTAPDADGKRPEDAGAREAAHLPLRLAQAHESLATLEIGLLLNTAARLGYRQELLEKLGRSAQQELREAEEVRARYEEALLRLRTARRIDRLERDLRRLRLWAAQDETVDAPERAALRQRAYGALIDVHEAVRDAASARRAMAAGSAREVAPGAAKERRDKDERTEDGAHAGPQLSLPVAAPEHATWDPKFMELARRELEDPRLRDLFDAQLVAEHYLEATEEVHALVDAERAAQDERTLRTRFEAADAAAQAALAPLKDDLLSVYVRRLPDMHAAAQTDFEAAMTGIEQQRVRNGERLAALIAYQDLLTRQGTRSLLIRVDRSRRDPFFGEVMSDTRSALSTAGEWASFEGESHLGAWVASVWPRLLIALLVLVGVFFLSRVLRRWLDGRIDRMVESVPSFGASVREERERAKRRRRRSDEAARAITDDDVLQVQPEPRGDEAEDDAADDAASDDDADDDASATPRKEGS